MRINNFHFSLIIKDIQTEEEVKIQVEEAMATYFKNECSDNEVIYVFYDKDSKELKLKIIFWIIKLWYNKITGIEIYRVVFHKTSILLLKEGGEKYGTKDNR